MEYFNQLLGLLVTSVLGLLYLLLKKLLRIIYNTTNGNPHTKLNLTAQHSTPGYRYPFTSFPMGWFYIMNGADLKTDQVVPIQCLGKEMVLFRTSDDLVHLFHAFCPHLGAHLGFGGKVQGNCIQCPFHGWKFDAEDGLVTDIPYFKGKTGTLPNAQLEKFHVVERNRLIFMWNDGGKFDRYKDPTFEIPVAKELDDANSWELIRFQWRCRVHIQEIAENAVDIGHFNIVHAFKSLPELEELVTDGPRFRVIEHTNRQFLGEFDITRLEITYHGLGVVESRVTSKYINLFVILTTTPISEEDCEINIYVRIRKTNFLRDLILKWYLPYHIGYDFYKDIPIWENKLYRPNPTLCKGDGPIAAIRRWAKQFYIGGSKIQLTDNNNSNE